MLHYVNLYMYHSFGLIDDIFLSFLRKQDLIVNAIGDNFNE